MKPILSCSRWGNKIIEETVPKEQSDKRIEEQDANIKYMSEEWYKRIRKSISESESSESSDTLNR